MGLVTNGTLGFWPILNFTGHRALPGPDQEDEVGWTHHHILCVAHRQHRGGGVLLNNYVWQPVGLVGEGGWRVMGVGASDGSDQIIGRRGLTLRRCTQVRQQRR